MTKVFSLNNESLSQAISKLFFSDDVTRGLTIQKFADGEEEAQFTESIRGADVVFITSTDSPEAIMRLLLCSNAAYYASAKSITAVIPYFGYARQDRKSKPRVSCGARLMADIIQAAHVTRVITMDLHAAQEQLFFNIPVDLLHSTSVFVPYLKSCQVSGEEFVIVAPDAGASHNCEVYSNALQVPLVVCHKVRSQPNEVASLRIIGDVTNKNCYIIDDMIDTAGTLVKCAEALRKAGALSVKAICTHGLLSDPALERLAYIDLPLICTDTVCSPSKVQDYEVTIVSVAEVFAKAIYAAINSKSIDNLYVVSSH